MTSKLKALQIRTPEGVVFALELASPIARFLALLIDKVFVLIVSGVVTMALRVVRFVSADFVGAAIMIVTFVISLGYPVVFEWWMRGQTPGKRFMKIQVMDEQALRLRFSQVVIRNILRFVDALPAFYLLGGAACMATARAQRLGDIAANTIVVQHRDPRQPDLNQLLPGKYNSFRTHPHLAARMRQNVPPLLAGLSLQALLRRDSLEEDARLRVFAAIRQRLEDIVVFPPESIEGLSDENYVRNAVDVIFK